MGDISNTVLIALVLVAIVVSVGGTMVTLSMIRPTTIEIAGLYTDTGELKFEILSVVSINVIQDTMNFGAGRVNETCTYCYLDSNESDITDSCHKDASDSCGNWSWTAGDSFAFEVENTGTVTANVTIYSNASAAEFIGGTGPGQWFFSKNNETNSCGWLQTSWTALGKGVGNATDVCLNFNHEALNDTFFTHIRLKVPEDATPGARTATITFDASQA